MNVVLYMRYSSDHQTEQSIEGQERVCTDFCTRNNYNIIDRYIDRATSAYKNVDKRLEFQRMIKDSAKGNFDAVVVYKLDRFSRNRFESATYKNKLKINNVKLISATEAISDNPEGILLESVLEGLAEFYSKELSQKVKRGMTESALKCNSTGGHIPLGYKIENKKYVIDETTAPIVREAFKMYAEGKSIVEIINTFNNRGYKSSKGSSFNKSSFGRMFANKKYIGTFKYDGEEIEDAIPAIIDKETFEMANSRIDKIKQAPARGKAKVDYLLTGKVFCGHCKEPMRGNSGIGASSKTYNYYVCAGRQKKKCTKENENKEFLENAVIQDTYEILTPDIIDKIADIAVEESKKEASEHSKITFYEDRLKDINSRIKNLSKALEIAPDIEDITQRVKELVNERKQAEKELLHEKNGIFILEKDQVVWWLNQFLNGDINDSHFRKRLIEMLVNRVEVYDDEEEPDKIELHIYYNSIGNHTKNVVRISPSMLHH